MNEFIKNRFRLRKHLQILLYANYHSALEELW